MVPAKSRVTLTEDRERFKWRFFFAAANTES
jgi:hypothetical protein